MSQEQSNKTPENKSIERPIKKHWGGYTHVVELDGEIIGLRAGGMDDLDKGREVHIVHNVNRNGETGTIDGFVDPDKSDDGDIVIVSVNGKKIKLPPHEVF